MEDTKVTGDTHIEQHEHDIRPLVPAIISYMPHLTEVVRGRILDEKLAAEKQQEQERVAGLPLPSRVYHNVLKKKFLQMMDDDSTVPARVKERLPQFWSRVVSFLAKLAFISIICILTWINYENDQQTKYLSLDRSVNDKSSPYYDPASGYRSCETTPNAITGRYILDANGYWSGTTRFVPGLGKLQLSFNDFEQSDETYKTYMERLNASIASQVSLNAAKRSSAMNLLYSMAWTLPIANNATGSTDYLSLLGDPAFALNRFFKNAALGSAAMSCYTVPSILYERASANFELRFSMGSPTFTDSTFASDGSGFLADSPSKAAGCCRQVATPYFFDKDTSCIVAPRNFGYSTMTDSTFLSFKYSIRTLSVALAVNLGILGFDTLTTVYTSIQNSAEGCFALNNQCRTATSVCAFGASLTYASATKGCSITVSGKAWFIEAKMLALYPGMDPVYCLTPSPGAKTTVGCFVRLGTSFTLPFFNHMGIGVASRNDFYNFRSSCECSAPDMSTLPALLQAFYTNNMHSDRSEFQGSFWAETYGKADSYCSKFDFLHGLIMMKGARQDLVLKHFLINVLTKYTPAQINVMGSISGLAAIKTAGSAGSQKRSTWTVGNTFPNKITKEEYITALTVPDQPPQIGWYVSINGNSAGQEFGDGLFIRRMKSFTVGTTPTFQFQLSGDVKFKTSASTPFITLVASPIEIGNTQLGDFKQAMGTTDAVAFKLFQTVMAPNDMSYSTNKPFVVASSVSGLVSNNRLGVTCSCSKVIIITSTNIVASPATTKTLTYSESPSTMIAVGNPISSSDIILPAGAIITAISGNALTLNVDFSCAGTCSATFSFFVTVACLPNVFSLPPGVALTIKSVETPIIWRPTLATTTISGSLTISIGSVGSSRVAVGSIVTSSTFSAFADATYVTALQLNSITISSPVLQPTNDITITTNVIELSQGMQLQSSDGELSCAASYVTNAYSWCTEPTGSTDAGADCVALAMQTFDTLDQRLNQEGAVPQTSFSCNDDFSLTAAALALATATPPAPLVLSYYECYNTKLSSFNVGFGVASGIAGSVTPVAVIVFVFCATKLAIPLFKGMHRGANRLSGNHHHSSATVVAVNGECELAEFDDPQIGDSDGDGHVDESELDGFGRVKR